MRLLFYSVKLTVFLLLLASAVISCRRLETESEKTMQTLPSRWYSAAQVAQGQQVFAANCASCHGEFAQGLVEDWKAKLADGAFPPPPLDGSAHAWHHPLSVLMGVINDGGVALGGNMPGFQSTLTEQEKLAVIAFFQNYWSDEIYSNWLKMGGDN
ncbi:MAG: mono/diheme cytochrome c family protein [Pseudohongiellaceae bacterium]|jgi:mono/diheme cytochrome c family protein